MLSKKHQIEQISKCDNSKRFANNDWNTLQDETTANIAGPPHLEPSSEHSSGPTHYLCNYPLPTMQTWTYHVSRARNINFGCGHNCMCSNSNLAHEASIC